MTVTGKQALKSKICDIIDGRAKDILAITECII
jgi:hypothetical protein